MTLIDEDGNEYPTIYLKRKTGLSGGWKGFAVAHDLADGDALIFQLINRTTFKVTRHTLVFNLFHFFIFLNYGSATYYCYK